MKRTNLPFCIELAADPGGFSDLGSMSIRFERRIGFFLDDAALGFWSIGLGGLLAEVHALDDGTLLRNLDLQDFARLALAVAGDDLNLVPFLICNFTDISEIVFMITILRVRGR